MRTGRSHDLVVPKLPGGATYAYASCGYRLLACGRWLELGVSSDAGAGGDVDDRAEPEGTEVGAVGEQRRVHGATSSPKRSDAHWAGVSRRAIKVHVLHKSLSLARRKLYFVNVSQLKQAKLVIY